MTSKRAGIVVGALLAYLVIILLTALMLVSNPALAQLAATYNIVRGTDCNDWSDGHNHTPENDRCNRPDLEGTGSPDKFLGSPGWDYQTGKGGDDLMYGAGGMDQGYGGQGNDTCIYGPGHDHCWGNQGDDFIDVSDGKDEPDHIEEVHGQEDTDRCILDNDVGDEVTDCETVIVVRNNGERITFHPNASISNTPDAVNVTVKMPNDKTGD